MSVQAPEGMSPVNAFYVLWLESHPFKEDLKSGQLKPLTYMTADKVAQFIEENRFIDGWLGVQMMVRMTEYPKINNINEYCNFAGGLKERLTVKDIAAKLQKYHQRSDKDKFDQNDFYIKLRPGSAKRIG